jgi:prolyl-tRNA synthetase
VMAKSGEDAVARCPKCSYGANTEKAVGKIADAGLGSDAAAELREVATPNMKSIEDVAKFLGVTTSKVVKTLMYDTDLGPVMVLIRGDREVNEIKVKNYTGAQWVVMLADDQFMGAVGGPAGFVGPVGAKKIRIVADKHLEGTTNWVTGANKLDAHYTGANLGRDFESPEFADVLLVREGDLCLRCGTAMEIHRGIEVGHIFKLGTKYSKAMSCVYLDEGGERQPMIMGCYGLGVGRTVAAAIEQNHDADGIIWPIPIAPFEVMIVTAGQDENVRTTAAEIHDKLEKAGVDVMLDDRDERPGVKFKDADLVGFPIKITVGAKSLAEGKVEWSVRREPKKRNLGTPEEVVATVVGMVKEARG